MAVIRDVNLDTTNDNIIFIGTICALLCLIIAVLGIKLRWFKHRMNLNDIPITPMPTNQSNGIEPQILRATFRPSSDFDNYVEVTPPKVLPPVRIPRSARNAISLPPKKRQAPNVPILTVSNSDTNSIEIEPLRPNSTNEQTVDCLVVEERRQSTPPPPLPTSPPPIEHEESQLLLLETNNNYNHHEDEPKTKFKEVENVNKVILPLPPPYQVDDPLAHNHFKKFTKKKSSSTSPVPTPHKLEMIALQKSENELPKTTTKFFSSSPSPKEEKPDRKHSFLYQVPTPTEIPKLAFDFPSTSMPNLSDPGSESFSKEATQSTLSLSEDQLKSNETKKGFFGLFRLGGKADNDANKIKNEKKEHPLVEKIEKIQKPKVKKIRVLKTEKKENVPKVKVNKNARLATPNQIDESIKEPEMKMKSEQPQMAVNSTIPDMDIMENRLEIDYFHKIKKPKANRVPIIIKSPKAQIKSEEKPIKNEVFRHEETFSAANGPVKVKKKKTKSTQEEASIASASKSSENTYNDSIKIKPSSPKLNEDPPVPKPRVILKLDGFDDNNPEMEIKSKSKRNVEPPTLSPPSSPSDAELDTWNLVAQHRLNTRAINAASISVRQNSDSDGMTNGSMLQMKQIDILTKPKTMREMKREQEERRAQTINFGGKQDKESDTEA